MKRFHFLIVAILLVLFMGLGWYFGQKTTDKMEKSPLSQPISNGVVQDDSGKTVKYWYDPMVPAQKFDKPGKSPFMDMQLEPKYAESAAGGSGVEEAGVSISSQTVQNLGIRLAKVEAKSFGESFSAVGRIEPDERRFYVVQTRISGFVERLYVRAVGDPVNKGQKIAEIYAPELLAAQQEYLTLLTLNQIDADGSLKQATRNRLKLLGMVEGEIAAITKAGKPSPRFGVYAPAPGVLTELGVREGGQLMSGSSLMQISDLSQVWLIAEVPERDTARLKLGIEVAIQLQSLPSETFKGKVSYLYPALNEVSRTLQVRIELPNKTKQLRPGMYANVAFTGQTHEALSVPTESIVATGKRKIVIVKEGDLKKSGGYRPVELTTGQERDNFTEVLSGVSEGEEVVVSGQFLIDSEATLSGVLARLSNQNQPTQNQSQQDKSMEKGMDHGMGDMKDMQMSKDKPMSAEKKALDKMPRGLGKVVDVDVKSGHVTLNHEPITELGWPSMTMGFKVKDSKQLGNLKAGDEVTFDLKAEAPEKPDTPAQYRIERVEKAQASKNDMKDSMEGAKP
ncbi:MAG: efflux RND transporter periplasmic adaptor subunit [Bdellovibrio sp.]|nr:efflux RND transporter periplasmic adaptor subunit [Methylotenera sp.]